MTKHQNKIEKLIGELCPEGVGFKELREVCKFQNGFAFKSSLFKTLGLPIIRITNIQNDYLEDINGVYFERKDYSENLSQYEVSEGDILIAMSGATTGKIGYVKSKKTFYLNQRVGKFIPQKNVLNNRFLFHFLLSKTTDIYIMAGGGAQPNLSSIKLMKEIKIPIPPLQIQQEIVKILDSFTELEAGLEAELEAELEARKKQYEYYRNKLLSTKDNDVESMKLGEIAEYRRGSFPQPYGESRWYGGDGAMPFVQVADVNEKMCLTDDTKRKISKLAQPMSVFVPKGTVLVTLQGSIGRVAITQYDCFVDRTLAIFERFKIQINKKYFAYQIEKKFALEKETARGSTIKTITKEEFTEFKIPVPLIQEQKDIVSKLDKFNSLVNDISIGLPAELSARRQQYEYYRNKLLTFKEYGK